MDVWKWWNHGNNVGPLVHCLVTDYNLQVVKHSRMGVILENNIWLTTLLPVWQVANNDWLPVNQDSLVTLSIFYGWRIPTGVFLSCRKRKKNKNKICMVKDIGKKGHIGLICAHLKHDCLKKSIISRHVGGKNKNENASALTHLLLPVTNSDPALERYLLFWPWPRDLWPWPCMELHMYILLCMDRQTLGWTLSNSLPPCYMDHKNTGTGMLQIRAHEWLHTSTLGALEALSNHTCRSL